jgi:hypothetical protein
MTRLTGALFAGRNVRDPMQKFTNYRPVYPFKQVLPPVLRNEVSRKGEKQKSSICLQEMSLMLVCLKKHDFEQSRCAKEIEGFITCTEEHAKAAAEAKKATTSSTTSGRYPVDVVNSHLRLYPQPASKKT